ncbi:MAG TPA: glutathione S-transferase family protein [Thermoleophilaceae bacterium]
MRLYDYAASANCYKVRLALAQLELPYERVPIDIFAGDTLTDEFGRLNPARTTPVLARDGQEPLPESAAIVLHLAEGTALLPADPGERAQVYRWLVFEQTDVIPAVAGLRFRLQTGRLGPDDDGARERRASGEQEVLPLLADHLATRDFAAGADYSVADIALYGYLHVAHEAGYDVPAPVRRWLERVEAQPRFMNDLEPYPPNARPGAGRSVYDATGA